MQELDGRYCIFEPIQARWSEAASALCRRINQQKTIRHLIIFLPYQSSNQGTAQVTPSWVPGQHNPHIFRNVEVMRDMLNNELILARNLINGCRVHSFRQLSVVKWEEGDLDSTCPFPSVFFSCEGVVGHEATSMDVDHNPIILWLAMQGRKKSVYPWLSYCILKGIQSGRWALEMDSLTV